MYVSINGTDITRLIVQDGVKWQRNDIDGPNAGRNLMSARMIRDRRATKIRLDIKCLPLSEDEARQLFELIEPEFVTVQYDDPMYGMTTKIMYSNNIPAQFNTIGDGTNNWKEIEFPLIEQ